MFRLDSRHQAFKFSRHLAQAVLASQRKHLAKGPLFKIQSWEMPICKISGYWRFQSVFMYFFGHSYCMKLSKVVKHHRYQRSLANEILGWWPLSHCGDFAEVSLLWSLSWRCDWTDTSVGLWCSLRGHRLWAYFVQYHRKWMSCIDVDSATHFESYWFPTGLKANQWFEQQARGFLAQKLYPDGTRCSNTEFLQRCEDGVM